MDAVSQFCSAAVKLAGHPLGDAVDAYLSTSATIKPMPLAEAVEKFVALDQPRTMAEAGERPELCPKYCSVRATMLRRFAAMFQNYSVSAVGKADINVFFAALPKALGKSRNGKAVTSPATRNHYRESLRQFFSWAVRNDLLPAGHRLLEADSMRPQKGNGAKVEFYSAPEFKALLEAAEGPMRAMIAIGGLAGLRTAELLRLDWEDTRRCEGHIEITSGKSKTRSRRLVEIVPALAQWLAPFGEVAGRIWPGAEVTFQQHFDALCNRAQFESKGRKVAVERKRNGLRHSYCTYHLAAHGNENATALQAGHSPQMLFAHYRGMATRKEGEVWFAVTPSCPANVIQMEMAESK